MLEAQLVARPVRGEGDPGEDVDDRKAGGTGRADLAVDGPGRAGSERAGRAPGDARHVLTSDRAPDADPGRARARSTAARRLCGRPLAHVCSTSVGPWRRDRSRGIQPWRRPPPGKVIGPPLGLHEARGPGTIR